MPETRELRVNTVTVLSTASESHNNESVQNADCRLQTGYKMQTRSKMQNADCRLGKINGTRCMQKR